MPDTAAQTSTAPTEGLREALAHIERAGELLPSGFGHDTVQLGNRIRKALQAQGVQLDEHRTGLTVEREAIEGAVTILHSGESTGDLDGAVDQVLESLESVLEAG